MLTATTAALRTSSKAKRKALRSAVLNAATSEAPDRSEQQVFIGLVDRFTDWHLLLLAAFGNPKQWRDQNRVPYDPGLSSSNAS